MQIGVQLSLSEGRIKELRNELYQILDLHHQTDVTLWVINKERAYEKETPAGASSPRTPSGDVGPSSSRSSQRELASGLEAWKQVSFQDVHAALVSYYHACSVPLFSYPHCLAERFEVPLYVRDEWANLSNGTLQMFPPEETDPDHPMPYEPTQYEQDFLALYHQLHRRKNTSWDPKWNDPKFVLTRIKTRSHNNVLMHFEYGLFLDAVMCQYSLEHEVRVFLAKGGARASIEHWRLPLRDELAASAEAIETFCQNQEKVYRIGISNLLLLKKDDDTYVPVVAKRGSSRMGVGDEHLFCTPSSGIFDISTTPKADFELAHKVLKEIYEELYGGKGVERWSRNRNRNPRFFYYKPGIVELLKDPDLGQPIFAEGKVTFEVTGLCLDLVNMVPEITTVLIVRDTSYYERYCRRGGDINEEYIPTEELLMPRNLKDIDDLHDFLAGGIVTDPTAFKPSYGFDPMLWTLPAAFCFYQGLKRAVSAGLL